MAVVSQRHSPEIKGEAGLESAFGACAAGARAQRLVQREPKVYPLHAPRSNASALAPVIPEIEAQIGANLTGAVADRGYRGDDAPPDYEVKVCVLGQGRRVIETTIKPKPAPPLRDRTGNWPRQAEHRKGSRVRKATATTLSSPPSRGLMLRPFRGR
jgi:hypothetical protein